MKCLLRFLRANYWICSDNKIQSSKLKYYIVMHIVWWWKGPETLKFHISLDDSYLQTFNSCKCTHTDGRSKCVIIHFGLFLNNWKKRRWRRRKEMPSSIKCDPYVIIPIWASKWLQRKTNLNTHPFSIWIRWLALPVAALLFVTQHKVNRNESHLMNRASFQGSFSVEISHKNERQEWNESRRNARIRKKANTRSEGKKKQEYHKKRTSGKMKQGSDSKLKKALTVLLTNYLQTKRQLKTDEE